MDKKVFVKLIMDGAVITVSKGVVTNLIVNTGNYSNSLTLDIVRAVCNHNKANVYNIEDTFLLNHLVGEKCIAATETNLTALKKSLKVIAAEWHASIVFPTVVPDGSYTWEEVEQACEEL